MARDPWGALRHLTMYVDIGYWVQRTERGYKRLPVYFYRDAQGNIVAAVCPDGRIKKFQTSIIRKENSISVHANACEYYIAKCPTQNWRWVDGKLGCLVDGKIVILNHDPADIFRKRHDVADFLARQNPKTARAIPVIPSRRPSHHRPALSTKTTAPHLPYAPPIAQLGWQLGYSVMIALTAMAPPGIRDFIRNVWNEYARQMSLVRSRLGPEKVKKWDYLWWRLTQAVNRAYSKYPYKVRQKIRNRLWRQYFEPKMFEEAGLDPHEVTASSPYIPQALRALSQIPHPKVQALVPEIWRRWEEYRKSTTTKVQSNRETEKLTRHKVTIPRHWQPNMLANRIARQAVLGSWVRRGQHWGKKLGAEALSRQLKIPMSMSRWITSHLEWEEAAELGMYLTTPQRKHQSRRPPQKKSFKGIYVGQGIRLPAIPPSLDPRR